MYQISTIEQSVLTVAMFPSRLKNIFVEHLSLHFTTLRRIFHSSCLGENKEEEKEKHFRFELNLKREAARG